MLGDFFYTDGQAQVGKGSTVSETCMGMLLEGVLKLSRLVLEKLRAALTVREEP